MPNNPVEKGKNSIELPAQKPSERVPAGSGQVQSSARTRRAVWSIVAGGLILLSAALLFWLNHPTRPARSSLTKPGSTLDPALLRQIPNAKFTDVTSSAGI